MADLANLRIAIDSRSARTAVSDLQTMGREAERLEGKTAKLERGASGAFNGIASSIKGAGVALAGFAGAQALIRIVDDYTKLAGQLKIATDNQTQFNQALSDVRNIASRAQAELSSVSALYSRLNLSLREIGVSQSDVAKITETVALSLKAAGAGAGETSSAMLQLSQAFGSGVLRGEEFNALMEASPNLMRALASSIGIPLGQLRSLAAEGKITSDVLVKAFADDKLLNTFREQARQVQTISGGFTALKNSLVLLGGEIENQTGIGGAFAQVLQAIATGIQSSANIIKGDLKGALDSLYPTLQKYNEAMGRNQPKFSFAPKIGDDLGAMAQALKTDKPSLILAPELTKKQIDETAKLAREAQEKLQKEQEQLAKERLEKERAMQNAESLFRSRQESELQDKMRKAYESRKKDEDELAQETAKQEYETRLKYMALLQEQANENYKLAQQAANKQAEEYERVFKQANDNFARSITDSIVRGFERGDRAIDVFKNAISSAFRGYFVNIGVNFVQGALSSIVGGIGRSVLGAIGLGGSGNAMASEGVGGLIDNAKNIYNVITQGFDGANASIIGGIESLGAAIADGAGGLRDTIGGFIGENSGVISQVLPFAQTALKLLQGDIKGAAFTGAGTAIGTFFGGPVGGAIGSFIGSAVGGLFGGKKPKLKGDIVTGNFANGQFNSSASAFGKSSLGGGDTLSQLSAQFSNSLGALLGAFDENIKFTTDAIYRTRTNQRAGFNVNGQTVYNNKNAGMDDFIKNVLGVGIVRALNQFNIVPDAFKQLFSGLTDAQDVQAAIGATISLKNANTALVDAFGITSEQVARLAVQSGATGQQLTQFVNAVIESGKGAQSAGSQILEFKSALTNALGGTLYADLKEFDAAIKAIDKSTDDGLQAFQELYALRPLFQQFTNAIGGLKAGVESAIYSLLTPSEQLAQDTQKLGGLFTDLGLSMPKTADELIAIGRGIDFTTESGLNLAAAFPSLVQAFDAVNQAQVDASQSTNALVDSLRDLASQARIASGETNPVNNLQSLRNQFNAQAQLASLGDTNAANALIGTGQQLIESSREFSSSRDQFLRDLAIIENAALVAANAQMSGGFNNTDVTITNVSGGGANVSTQAGGGGDFASEVRLMRAELAELRKDQKDSQFAIAKNTLNTYTLLNRWDDGDRLNVHIEQDNGETLKVTTP